ncbi:hypothetical protein [Luteolibacter luteus]|uniref:Uncharacterized protein n=1 Tax=Luteolibacter luteus TaxID=2728835 RepID=A0A858RI60_9BACT|nr:hypothetical protein [Luteolibacter luteus]QJE96188.1 hypothetical protein HHL09_10455 [Luteolibacter luteus]
MSQTPILSRLRILLPVIAAILLIATAAIFFSGSRPATPSAGASETKRADTHSQAPARDAALTSADWMERIRQSPAENRPELMREILAIVDATLRAEISTALATEWMKDDLDNYLAFVDEMMVGEGLSSELMQRFSVALMGSFEASASKTELKGKIRYVAEAVVSYLIANDLDGAEDWARTNLVKLDLDMALARIAPPMAASSPTKAMEIFGSITSAAPRLSGASALGAALVKQDPDTAIRWANSIRANSERSLAMNGVVGGISPEDPARAASLLKGFLEKIQNEYNQIRERDRQQAGVKPEDEFQTPELYAEYLENNGYAIMQPDTPEADYLIKAGEQIGFEIAKTDPLAALDWAKSLSVGILQAHAVSGALSGWSTWAPQEAVSHYLQNYAYDPAIPVSLFENWASQDPQAAIAAIKSLPDGGQQSSAIRGVISGWLDSGEDLPGLVAWADQLKPGADRDDAHLSIIEQTSELDANNAWQLVSRIENPVSRKNAAEDVFSIIAFENPAAARQMLQHYAGPDSEIQALTRILSLAEES